MCGNMQLEDQRVNRWCRVLFGHVSKHAIRAGSCNRQRRVKRRSSRFPVRLLSVNGYDGPEPAQLHRTAKWSELQRGQ